MFVWNFMEPFVEALRAQLEDDEKRWGDTWRRRVRYGHEERIFNDFADYYDQFKNSRTPIPWLKVAAGPVGSGTMSSISAPRIGRREPHPIPHPCQMPQQIF